MQFKARSYIVLLLLPLLMIACNGGEDKATAEAPITNNAEQKAAATTQMPAFTMIDASGQPVDLKSFAGKKVFVNLWATWCPPCRVEMPSIEKLHASVDKNKAAFIMLSLDDDFEKAKEYVAKNNLDLPVYYPQGTNLPTLFQVRGIPATFIFDENGNLIKSTEGAADYDTEAYRQLLK